MRYHNGDSIGEYVIIGHLGSGGSADVFCVEHNITGRREALKLLSSGIDEQRAERILREAKLQARLDHPNITAVHHAFWWKGDLALVMELVDGESLCQVLERGPISFDTALVYARQILRALDHAHRRQVIHRDITPANIMVTPKGLVKLTDFGLAKEPADRKITQTGIMLGSLHYCSPEQIRSSGEVDSRTDIYSCGAVLYEMLTGQKPFEGDNSFDLMLAQTEVVPEAPSQVNRALSVKLDQCLLKALEKNPADRFATAAEFLAGLEGVRRRVPALAYAAAAFAVVGLFLTAATVRWADPGQAEGEVPMPPMTPLAIVVPPIPLPLLTLPGLAPSDEPVKEHTVAPAVVRMAKPRPAVVLTRLPQPVMPATPSTRPPAPAPVQPEFMPTVPATVPRTLPPVMAAAESPKEPPPPSPAAISPPAAEHPGFLRTVVRRLNVFRKRANATTEIAPKSSVAPSQ